MAEDIKIGPINIVLTYGSKIRALIKLQIRVLGGQERIKASIALKIFYLNENTGEVYSHFLHTEMLVLHPHLENYEGLFMEWVNRVVTNLDDYNEKGSGSVVLFIEKLELNITKLKKNSL